MINWRSLLIYTTCTVLTFFCGMLPSHSNARDYTAIVIDADSSETLHSVNAEELVHPAGLTKLMTLYVIFEAIEGGEIELDAPIRISKKAAAEQPVKLGLRAGQRIKLRYLIRAAGVGGSNDAATAIAEGLSGSEAAFARRMNRTSIKLGLGSSRWKNAHGLTEKGHLSTAKDLAILMNAHRRDFPDYFNLFSRTKTHAGLRELKHSGARLLGEIDNTIAVKTGFTRASGFSGVVMTSEEKRTITTVAMGRYTTRDLIDKLQELIGVTTESRR